MIKKISWQEIETVWRKKLWPGRSTPIETNSAMCFGGGHDMTNMTTTVSFFGYFIGDKIVGVNSGHGCFQSKNYRSRGLWVDKKHRRKGIGQCLLQATVQQGFEEGYNMIWSYPRQSSWPTYSAVGFELQGDWHASDTAATLGFKLAGLPKQTLNAYCFLNRK